MQYFWIGVMYNFIRKSKISAICSFCWGLRKIRQGIIGLIIR